MSNLGTTVERARTAITGDGETLCLECAEAIYPRGAYCTGCGKRPSEAYGLAAVGRLHSGCDRGGKFIAHDDRSDHLERKLLSGEEAVECGLCGNAILGTP